MISRRLLVVASLIALTALGGCSDSAERRASTNNELLLLGAQYMAYFRSHGNKAPANEQELKDYINSTMTDVKRELLKITDTNQLFISPRDKKPFVVRYGATLSNAPPKSGEGVLVNGDIVIYEAEGLGGVRQVYSSLGHITEIKVEDLKQLVPDAQ